MTSPNGEALTLLQVMFETRQVSDAAGRTYPLDSEIEPRFARALYETVRREQPALAIEVGMAYGVSTLAILAGLAAGSAEGRLISIDPMQDTAWHDVGVANVHRAGLEERHRVVREPDYQALPDLLRQHGRAAGLIYVDGWHTFDYTLLDLFYADRLVKVGGIVAINDGWMLPVHQAIGTLLQHRHYASVDVGLAPAWRGRTKIHHLARQAMRINGADQYYRKRDDWEPAWNFMPRSPRWYLP